MILHPEGVIDNIAGWLDGKERLDVRALDDELERRYGPTSPTDYNARLLFDLYCLELDAEPSLDAKRKLKGA